MAEEKTNLFNPILVGLLVIASFFLGNFYAKTQMLEESKNNKKEIAVADQAVVAGEKTEEVVPSGPESITPTAAGVTTFKEKKGAEIVKEDGKPVVYLFSTTWCPHCEWVKETFDSVANEYVSAGKIKAYHWELDTKDNTLTAEVESDVPVSHNTVYEEFNPKGSIPTYVIGGKYFRVGNGHEGADDLNAEAAELRAAIDAVLQ